MGGRRRSRSPSTNRSDDRHRNYGRGSYDSSRGDSFSRGGRRDFRGSLGSATPVLQLDPLPDYQIPAQGRELPSTSFRPRNTSGNQILVDTNHFAIKTLPTIPIWIYDLKITVSEDSIRPHKLKERDGEKEPVNKVLASQLARALLHSDTQELLGPDFVFDGNSMGWSPVQLIKEGEAMSTTLKMGERRDKAPNNVDFAMRCVGKLNVGELVTALQNGRASNHPSFEPFLKWLNALHKKDPSSRFITRPTQNVYFERGPRTATILQSTGGVLEALRGFFATVMVRFGQLTINIDSSTTPFWVPDLKLTKIAATFAGVRDVSELCEKHWGSVSSRITQVYCVAPHLQSNKRLKPKGLATRVDKNQITSETAHTHTFLVGDQLVTCYEYYKLRYHKLLEYPHFPLVTCREGLFPMELLFSAPGERYKELLQGSETADFIRFSCAPPNIRRYHTEEALRHLQWHNVPILGHHGISISTKFMKIPALVLPQPSIQYRSDVQVRGGKWNLRGVKFYEAKAIKSWGLMAISSRPPGPNEISAFSRALASAFTSYGMNCPREEPAFLVGNPYGDIASAILQLITITSAKFRATPDASMVLFFILQESSIETYKVIKNLCEVTKGIPSQCMIQDKALKTKGQDQYLGNVALKVNVKLGGRNVIFKEPSLRSRRFMFIGADTSHPSPTQLRLEFPPPAIAAVVGTYDQTCVAYTGVATAQNPTQQLIEHFEPMISELVSRYKEKNTMPPTDVVYFRDGLSESQFDGIKREEITVLKKILNSIDSSIKLTALVAIKRHHTRFFPRNSSQADEKGNLLAGTVIENAALANDFFLLSHASLQGTSRPTHYIVLHDDSNVPPKALHVLLNKMCSSYARATRAVAICPAVYYADQACTRAGLWVRQESNGSTTLPSIHKNLRFTMNFQ